MPNPYEVKARPHPFVVYEAAASPNLHSFLSPPATYRFQPFYDPYVCQFIEALNRDGLDGMLKWTLDAGTASSVQTLPDSDFFKAEYSPLERAILAPLPIDSITFDRHDPRSLYHLELFLHLPLAIIDRLMEDQKFEQALTWLRAIFDPTDGSSEAAPSRYWKLLPLRRAAASPVTDELADLFKPEKRAELKLEVNAWRKFEFDAHRLAESRTWTYAKAVVMRTLDALLARGDQLYRQYTAETISQATLFYVLASEIAGDPPPKVPPPVRAAPMSYEDLAKQPLDAFGDAIVACENLVFGVEPQAGGQNGGPTVPMLYFQIPQNQKLIQYWKDIESRLENIRHCRNIEGELQPIPLFGPPIDPDLLVRAAAAGIDLGSLLADLSAPAPHYRFQTLLQRAIEFCSDVRSLGSALLAALERRDGEAMALLRSSHELDMLNLVKLVKKQQLDEAQEAFAASIESKRVIQARLDYYTNIVPLNVYEAKHLTTIGNALDFQTVQLSTETLGAVLHLLPDFKLGALTTIGSTIGGSNIGGALQSFGAAMGTMASMSGTQGSLVATMGSFQRRQEEWTLQKNVAGHELAQIEHQILAAKFRVEIAQQEVDNHDRQVDNAVAIDEFMRSKATNQELFDWMVAQTSSLYFQAYQLAYGMGRRAERAWQLELGDFKTAFIKYGYWDSLKKGLLAGERLQLDLRRMDAAYLDRNKREYEITKHFSLAASAPLALLMLKQTGHCFVNISEAAYDADYPGHFMRRMRSVSTTVPGVTGPLTSINCTLTLISNRVRKDASAGGDYAYRAPDPRFQEDLVAQQSIVTSTGNNDTGVLFPDDRPRPFEFAGAISEWRIELPRDTNRFDLASVSDFILTIQYTAKNGGEALKRDARQALFGQPAAAPPPANPNAIASSQQLLSARRDLSNEWHRFLNPVGDNAAHTLKVDLSEKRFPYHRPEQTLTIASVRVLFELSRDAKYDEEDALSATLTNGGGATSEEQKFKRNAEGMTQLIEVNFAGGGNLADNWTLTITTVPKELGLGGGSARIDPKLIEDCFFIASYTLT